MINYENIEISHSENGVLLITLSREDQLNALSEALLDELSDVILDAQHDESIKGLIITGKGKAFCVGASIDNMAVMNAYEGQQFAEYGQTIFRHLEQLGKPSIAAVNGYAFGGGCELSMACTLRIASEQAQFGQPEVKLGIIPGYGGTQRLPRLVGKGRAMELCLTGRFINAQESLLWGLVSEVVSGGILLKRAMEIMDIILMMAPKAIASVMTVIDKGLDLNIEDACHLEAIHFGLLCATDDKNEGIKAFLEKRKANFIGK